MKHNLILIPSPSQTCIIHVYGILAAKATYNSCIWDTCSKSYLQFMVFFLSYVQFYKNILRLKSEISYTMILTHYSKFLTLRFRSKHWIYINHIHFNASAMFSMACIEFFCLFSPFSRQWSRMVSWRNLIEWMKLQKFRNGAFEFFLEENLPSHILAKTDSIQMERPSSNLSYIIVESTCILS